MSLAFIDTAAHKAASRKPWRMFSVIRSADRKQKETNLEYFKSVLAWMQPKEGAVFH